MNPVKTRVPRTFIIVLLLFLFGCSEEPEFECVVGTCYAVEVFTDKTNYAPGEPVEMTVVVSNLMDYLISFGYANTCRCEYKVYNAEGNKVWDSAYHTYCFMMVSSDCIPAYEMLEFTRTWGQVDDLGNPVPPGEYEIQGIHLGAYDITSPVTVYTTGE